jgi:hypothetical protein
MIYRVTYFWFLMISVTADVKTAVKNKVPLVRSLTLNWVTFCIETSNKAVILKVHKDYVPICMEVSVSLVLMLMFWLIIEIFIWHLCSNIKLWRRNRKSIFTLWTGTGLWLKIIQGSSSINSLLMMHGALWYAAVGAHGFCL